MTWFVRVYETQKNARDAGKKLTTAGFEEGSVSVMTPKADKGKTDADAGATAAVGAKDTAGADVAAAAKSGRFPQTYATIATEALQAGRSVVAIDAPFGQGAVATTILDSFGPVQIDQEPDDASQKRLTSEALGIPLLWNSHSFMTGLFGGLLTNHRYSFFGSPRLKDDPAPLSSKMNMKTLDSDNPAPLSSKFGLKLLSEAKKDWTYSCGLPMLSSNPAPLSSMVGMKTLSDKPDTEWTQSFGQPLLSSNPTPLSTRMGWSVLIK